MCLTVDKIKTAKHSTLLKNKKIIFWKLFCINNQTLYSFYTMSQIHYQNDYILPKQNNGLQPSIQITKYNTHINGGCLHAFTLKPQLLDRTSTAITHNQFTVSPCQPNKQQTILLPIIVYSNDVIAYGTDNDACFFKYKFSKATKQKIKKILHQ